MLQDAIADRVAVASLQHDWIADLDVAQHGELRVAMRGDHAVAGGVRRCTAVHVARAECHRASARAGQDDVALALMRKLDPGHGPRVGPSPRLHVPFAVDRSRPRPLEEVLRELRLRQHVGTMSEEQHAGNRERTNEDEAFLHFQLRTATITARVNSTIPMRMYSGAGVAVAGRDQSTPPHPCGRYPGTARVSQICCGTPDGV